MHDRSSPGNEQKKESCPRIDVAGLIERYECFLLDAYGVLVDAGAAMGGARELLDNLRDAERDVLVVTNDASRLPDTAAERFRGFGLDIAAEKIITSGALLAPYFATTGLQGARCFVLGPEDSHEYVRRSGGEPVPLAGDAEIDAVVVCDDAGYPLRDSLDAVLSALFRHFDRGDEPSLVLPNPDLMYPRGGGDFGFTSGGVALLLEAALAQRYPTERPAFVRLGKPFGPIFREAKRRARSEQMVMIGDQIETDIVGARAAGIDAVYVDSGITNWERTVLDEMRAPNFVLEDFGSGS
jgi:HAD superfamily hydrolase (TIGR01450 family)